MILRGSAGTGKTALASAMVQTLRHLGTEGCADGADRRGNGLLCSMPDCPHGFHRRIYRERTFAGIVGTVQLSMPTRQRHTLHRR